MLQLHLISLEACLITEPAVEEGNAAAKCDEAFEEAHRVTVWSRGAWEFESPTFPLQDTIGCAQAALQVLVTSLPSKWQGKCHLPLSSVLLCITLITLLKLSTQHLTLILPSAVSAVSFCLTKRNTSTCASLELPLHRNIHLRALWLQHSLIS